MLCTCDSTNLSRQVKHTGKQTHGSLASDAAFSNRSLSSRICSCRPATSIARTLITSCCARMLPLLTLLSSRIATAARSMCTRGPSEPSASIAAAAAAGPVGTEAAISGTGACAGVAGRVREGEEGIAVMVGNELAGSNGRWTSTDMTHVPMASVVKMARPSLCDTTYNMQKVRIV